MVRYYDDGWRYAKLIAVNEQRGTAEVEHPVHGRLTVQLEDVREAI